MVQPTSSTSEQICTVAAVFERYRDRLRDVATEDVLTFARSVVVHDLPPVLPKNVSLASLMERACEAALVGTPARSPRGLVRHKVRELARQIQHGTIPRTFAESETRRMMRPTFSEPRPRVEPQKLAELTRAAVARLRKPSFG